MRPAKAASSSRSLESTPNSVASSSAGASSVAASASPVVASGDVAGAAAMAMLIVYISFLVRGIHTIISTFLLKRTQAWRNI